MRRAKLLESHLLRELNAASEPPTMGILPAHFPKHFLPLRITATRPIAHQQHRLTVALPEGIPSLEAGGPAYSVKISALVNGAGPDLLADATLEKSYSVISHPLTPGSFDLLIKRYPPRVGGGLGAHLCDRMLGDTIRVRLKPMRLLDGAPYHPNRWRYLSLIGNGTGIAPLYQLALTVLSNPRDTTEVRLLLAYRTEVDAPLTAELAALTSSFPPGRLQSRTVFSEPMTKEAVGRLVQISDVMGFLPPPSPEHHVVVCGSDGFLAHVCGPIVRVPNPKDPSGKKLKRQGPVVGLCGQAGFQPSQVTKL